MRRLQRALFAAVAAIGFASIASAADMPAKAPVYKAAPPVVMNDWSGIYVGVNGGWTRNNFDWAFDPALAGAPNQQFSLDKSSATIGGHVGIQKQFGLWVLGVELAYNSIGGEWARHSGFGVGAAFADARMDRLWTVGPRIGYAGLNNWLLFVDGGYANARVQTRAVSFATGLEDPSLATDTTQNGWYLGAGAEYRIWSNLILGLEYQHIDLRNKLHVTAAGGTNNHDIQPSGELVRARLSYLFNWPMR